MTKTLFAVFIVTSLLNGCMTYQPSRTAQVRQTEDQLIQQENQRRMAGRIETLELEISRISRELDALRQTLDARVTNIESKSEEDKRQIIARLTAQLEKLMAKTPAPAPAPSGGGAMQGYEHIVQQGDTLSTIAKAYNVTTKVLIDVNKLKNPDRLSIGQKLFIPE
jgi:LysM repeat protein